MRRRRAHVDREDVRWGLFEVVPHDDRRATSQPAIDDARSEVTTRNELHQLLFRRSPGVYRGRQDVNVVAFTDVIYLEFDVDVSIAALLAVRS